MDNQEKVKTAVLFECPNIYADVAGISFHAYTIRVSFGQITDKGNRPIIDVLMSPAHAKVFHHLLGESLKQYEEKVMHIDVPKEIKKNLNMKD